MLTGSLLLSQEGDRIGERSLGSKYLALKMCPPPALPNLHGDRPDLLAQPPLLHIRPPCYHSNKG